MDPKLKKICIQKIKKIKLKFFTKTSTHLVLGGGGDDDDDRHQGRGNRGRGMRKAPPLVVKLRLSLEELYVGKEIHFLISKATICDHCRGSGAEDPDDLVRCPHCRGQGHVVRRQQVAPGFVQQFQMQCDHCRGSGEFIKNKCHVCRGSKIKDGYEKMVIWIEKGMINGEKIAFNGGANDHLELDSSDLIFVIQELEHKKFTREKHNLRTEMKITLKEALTGFSRQLTMLDGRKITVSKSHVSQPGDIIRVSGEGMPVKHYNHKGDLLVKLNIHLPKEINAEKQKLWKDFFNVGSNY